MTPILLDVIIAAVVLLCVWSGYRKGFVLTLCGFLAVFVAFIGASILSSLLAEPVAGAITPMVEQAVRQAIETYSADALSVLSSSVSGLSASVSIDPEMLETIQVPTELLLDQVLTALRSVPALQVIADNFQAAVESGAIEVTADIAHALAQYIAVQIARIILFILAFVVILIAWFILSHALDLAFKLPVLSTLNRWGGAAVGLLKGLVLVAIALWLLKENLIPLDAIEGSYIITAVHNFTANYS